MDDLVTRLEQIGLGEVLIEWGLHECAGRLRAQVGSAGQVPLVALNVILCWRAPLLANLLAAGPNETWRIQLEPVDIPNLFSLENGLDGHSRAMYAAPGPAGDHVRELVQTAKIDGPIRGTAIPVPPRSFSSTVYTDFGLGRNSRGSSERRPCEPPSWSLNVKAGGLRTAGRRSTPGRSSRGSLRCATAQGPVAYVGGGMRLRSAWISRDRCHRAPLAG
jgi:hypothetical protein